jgi:ADP-ribose pyrophosphatase YjhB (NUDIX family)
MIEPLVVEETAWEGRPVMVSWLPAPFVPPRELTTQAYGVCFTEHRQIVLVLGPDRLWTLPGGTPENDETIEDAFTREVWEEACARVVRYEYMGCQRVDDPTAPSGPTTYYQMRFWARVEVYPWKPQFETTERRLVATDQFLDTLFWGHSPIARQILGDAIRAENRNSSACV